MTNPGRDPAAPANSRPSLGLPSLSLQHKNPLPPRYTSTLSQLEHNHQNVHQPLVTFQEQSAAQAEELPTSPSRRRTEEIPAGHLEARGHLRDRGMRIDFVDAIPISSVENSALHASFDMASALEAFPVSSDILKGPSDSSSAGRSRWGSNQRTSACFASLAPMVSFPLA
ncbi:hypothetical protein BO78DRAFT_44235 [Aspergillus sclerotiicarbonarius CBS 121057]|uniref:Uncharacterized protein n=1 Tax=Aspergillus sclerotiicarbonarius (strain CBS 121057 / IBT 28362) TaxID=1448318 RepID=A0A319EG96_ASPSB|nr:hypothetical protein BO78DRAFT_44235 [Aspergillus sclerotiicarbonarius CBS 121057]